MKSHRTIIAIGGLLVALAAALPAPALASSLLSGYGGPGEGNQAILGAALVNGGRGGGSGGAGGASGAGGGSSSVSGSSGSQSAAGAGTSQSSGGSGASGAGTVRSLGGAGGARRVGAQGAARNGARQGTRSAASGQASFYPASERVPAGEGSDALGLSGADLLYLLLAVGVLVFMGAITARLSRSTRRAGIGG